MSGNTTDDATKANVLHDRVVSLSEKMNELGTKWSERMVAVEHQLVTLETKVAERAMAMESKIDKIDTKIDKVTERTMALDSKVDKIDGKVDKVELKIDVRAAGLDAKLEKYGDLLHTMKGSWEEMRFFRKTKWGAAIGIGGALMGVVAKAVYDEYQKTKHD